MTPESDRSAERPIIGWVGLGRMGAAMAARVQAIGYPMVVTARRVESARSIIEAGAEWVNDAAEVARRSTIVVTVLGGPEDVGAVYLGHLGLLAGACRGDVLIDMTTSDPALARKMATMGADSGVHVLDAPVSGGPAAAMDGSLSIMVGGDPAGIGTARPILEVLGATIVRHGQAGSGQTAKLANQLLIAATMAGLVEAFEFARLGGLDPDAALRSLGAGIATSPLLRLMWPKFEAKDFGAGFSVDHFVKDLELAVAANRAAVAFIGLPVAEHVLARYRLLAMDGYGGSGTQVLLQTAQGIRTMDAGGSLGRP